MIPLSPEYTRAPDNAGLSLAPFVDPQSAEPRLHDAVDFSRES